MTCGTPLSKIDRGGGVQSTLLSLGTILGREELTGSLENCFLAAQVAQVAVTNYWIRVLMLDESESEVTHAVRMHCEYPEYPEDAETA